MSHMTCREMIMAYSNPLVSYHTSHDTYQMSQVKYSIWSIASVTDSLSLVHQVSIILHFSRLESMSDMTSVSIGYLKCFKSLLNISSVSSQHQNDTSEWYFICLKSVSNVSSISSQRQVSQLSQENIRYLKYLESASNVSTISREHQICRVP